MLSFWKSITYEFFNEITEFIGGLRLSLSLKVGGQNEEK
jgi:hypothetical protein